MPRKAGWNIQRAKELRTLEGLFGGSLKFMQWEEEVTIAAAAYTDSTSTFPVGSVPLSCTARVKTAIAGGSTATVFDVGISGNTNKFTHGSGTITVAAGSKGGGLSEDHVDVASSAIAVRITPDQTPATGKVILHAIYLLAVAPTRSTKK